MRRSPATSRSRRTPGNGQAPDQLSSPRWDTDRAERVAPHHLAHPRARLAIPQFQEVWRSTALPARPEGGRPLFKCRLAQPARTGAAAVGLDTSTHGEMERAAPARSTRCGQEFSGACAGGRIRAQSPPRFCRRSGGGHRRSVREKRAAGVRGCAATAPCLLFFDEFDSIAQRRDAGTHSEERRTVNQLLTSLESNRGVRDLIVVAATNDIAHLDPAVIRPGRFDRHLRIDLPDATARRAVLAAQLRDRPACGRLDLHEIADRSAGMTPAALTRLVDAAALARSSRPLRAASKSRSRWTTCVLRSTRRAETTPRSR